MTSTVRRPWLLAEGPRRLLAAAGIGLVLLLSVLSVDPELHERLHHHQDLPGHEDGCAVVLFAHGVSAPFDTAVLARTPEAWPVQPRTEIAEIFLASPRYLHLPERGPPAA